MQQFKPAAHYQFFKGNEVWAIHADLVSDTHILVIKNKRIHSYIPFSLMRLKTMGINLLWRHVYGSDLSYVQNKRDPPV